MRTSDLYAIGLGLVAAIVMVSATTGFLLLRVVLFLITPLPLFLAGLGWGPRAALVSGLTGTAVVAAVAPGASLMFLLLEAAPALTLTYLALLARPVPVAAPGSAQSLEWYPIGRVVTAAALLAGLPSVAWYFLGPEEIAAIKSEITTGLGEAIKAQLTASGAGTEIPEDEIKTLGGVVFALLPAGSAIVWMGALVLNLWLAGRITLASGQLARPWPDLAAMELPYPAALVLGAGLAAASLGGQAGMVASGFAGSMLLAYVLLGLAVVHYVSRGSAWRPFLLWGLYLALLLVAAWLALPLAILGLSETFLKLRRAPPQASGPS